MPLLVQVIVLCSFRNVGCFVPVDQGLGLLVLYHERDC